MRAKVTSPTRGKEKVPIEPLGVYQNQEEYYKEIERVFGEDYNVKLSTDQTHKIGEAIQDLCSKFLK